MAAPIKKTTDETGDADMHRIRITLTSRNMKAVEKLCEDLIRGAKKMVRFRVRRAEFGGVSRAARSGTWRGVTRRGGGRAASASLRAHLLDTNRVRSCACVPASLATERQVPRPRAHAHQGAARHRAQVALR